MLVILMGAWHHRPALGSAPQGENIEMDQIFVLLGMSIAISVHIAPVERTERG